MPLILSGTDGVSGNSGAIVSDTAKSATGTSVDFTGIPSWVKRVTVMLSSVSLSGTTSWSVQIGSGSFTTSGYVSGTTRASTGTTSTSTSGFVIQPLTADSSYNGHIILTLVGSNTWVSSHAIFASTSNSAVVGGGGVTLSGSLDRVRAIAGGADTFDAGTINILYE